MMIVAPLSMKASGRARQSNNGVGYAMTLSCLLSLSFVTWPFSSALVLPSTSRSPSQNSPFSPRECATKDHRPSCFFRPSSRSRPSFSNLRGSSDQKATDLQVKASGDHDVKQPRRTTPAEVADGISRRDLLFSMLAAASAGVAISPAQASAMDVFATVGIVSAASAAAISDIMKPPLDEREYEAYVLDNGLRVLLCSDPKSSTAAAAMDVHVGACSDPAEVPGLAHFNEHMLFLGTEKYPKEDGFSAFLASNGGSSNAFTDSEDTVYYFSMAGQAKAIVSEALSRFGSFFSSPLFTEGATGRELNSIESENAKNLQSDIFRVYQIEKSRANKKHPFSKFFTGNRSTLLDGTRKRNINLRNELLKFYETYYSANQMTLAVVAPQPLSTLRGYVSESFSSIPNRNRGPPEDNWAGIPPYASSSSVEAASSIIPGEGYVVEVVPVQDLRQVSLAWPIVFSSKEERENDLLIKPDFYVAHLLGHEGPGSLLSFLKKQGWANSLGSSTNAELSDFFTFEVSVELTNKGFAAVDDVCEAVFSYINMLRDQTIPDYIFDEVLQLSELEWRFLSKVEPSGYVQSLVTSMQKYEPSLYIAGPRRIALKDSKSRILGSAKPRTAFTSIEERNASKAAATNLVSKLSVDTVMMTILSKSFEGKTDYKEKWYGTGYNVREIPPATRSKWANGLRPNDIGIAFPKPNVFIPTETGLKLKKGVMKESSPPKTFEEKMKPATPPKLIRNDGHTGRWTVYYKLDDRFGQPKAFVIFELLTSKVYASATSAALALLYETCAGDSLDEYAYDAKLAGLSYDVQVLPRGVRLTFGGYNDKLQEFSSYVAGKLAQNVADVLPQTDEEFDRYKDQVKRALAAFDVKQPYSHAIYYSSLTFQPRRFNYPNADIRSALASSTRPQLEEYVKTLWSSGTGEALVQGNLEEQEALDLVDTIDRALGFRTISAEEYPPRIKALPLPPSLPSKLRVSEPNADNKNSVSQVVIQCLGRSVRDHMLIELLSAIISEPFYEDLRTKQQLGYIVSSGVKGLEETRNLSLIAQSSVAEASKLTAAILKFLDGFRSTHLDKLNEGDISTTVKGLLDNKLEPDKTLAAEVTRNWSEIATGRLKFDRLQREAAALLELTKEDLLVFWDTYFDAGSEEGRRLLITEIIPKGGMASSKAPPKTTGYGTRPSKKKSGIALGIDDIERFRKDRETVFGIAA